MGKHIVTLSTVLLLTCAIQPFGVRAENIVVTQGFVSLNGIFDTNPPSTDFFVTPLNFNLQGKNLIAVHGELNEVDLPFEYDPGDVVNLSAEAFADGPFFFSQVVVNGVDYTDKVYGNFDLDLNSISIKLPDHVVKTFSVEGHFTLSGSLGGYDVDNCCEDLLFSVGLKGQGTARLTLDGVDGKYRFNSQIYEFKPIPEPATLALLGTGLASIGAMIRRRRQGKD